MLIVLVIMAGTMALVWPSLRRAVDRSTLDEAANTFRSVLDESRVRALQSGSPWLIRLEPGGGLLLSGTIEQFMAQAASGRSLDDSKPEVGGTPDVDIHESFSEYFADAFSTQVDSDQGGGRGLFAGEPTHIRLPDQIHVADLVWNAGGKSLDSNQESFDQNPEKLPGKTWWITILANGISQDFSVRLQDVTSGKSLWLVHSGTRGSIESIP